MAPYQLLRSSLDVSIAGSSRFFHAYGYERNNIYTILMENPDVAELFAPHGEVIVKSHWYNYGHGRGPGTATDIDFYNDRDVHPHVEVPHEGTPIAYLEYSTNATQQDLLKAVELLAGSPEGVVRAAWYDQQGSVMDEVVEITYNDLATNLPKLLRCFVALHKEHDTGFVWDIADMMPEDGLGLQTTSNLEAPWAQELMHYGLKTEQAKLAGVARSLDLAFPYIVEQKLIASPPFTSPI
jgi:hypothetical protein